MRWSQVKVNHRKLTISEIKQAVKVLLQLTIQNGTYLTVLY